MNYNNRRTRKYIVIIINSTTGKSVSRVFYGKNAGEAHNKASVVVQASNERDGGCAWNIQSVREI